MRIPAFPPTTLKKSLPEFSSADISASFVIESTIRCKTVLPRSKGFCSNSTGWDVSNLSSSIAYSISEQSTTTHEISNVLITATESIKEIYQEISELAKLAIVDEDKN